MRIAFNALVILLTTALSVVGGTLTRIVRPDGTLGTYVTRYWSKMLLFCAGVKLDVTMAPGVKDEPCIVVANHASMLDIMVCAAALPVRFHFVSRPLFFKIPILGWGMFLSRHIAMDPSKPREAARVLRGLQSRFDKGTSVALFPEGTRSTDGTIAKYRRGPFLAAIQHGVPVQPIRHHDTYKLWKKGTIVLRPGTIRVVIGAPIPTEGMSPPDARKLAQQVEDWTKAN